MSDVAAEEVRAEMERATQVLDGYGAAVERQWIEPLKLRIMEAIATVRKEARREALKEALDMIRTAEQQRVDGWDVVADVLYRLGAAIRALMGPET